MTLPTGTTITIGGVTCEELQGSGRVQFTPEGPRGERNFHCAWDDRFDLARELRGYVRLNSQDPPNFFRVAPQPFPEFEGPLVCTDVMVSGVGTMSQSSAGYPTYDYARLDATYTMQDGQESDGDTGEEEVVATLDLDFHSEFITFGSYEYYWATSEQKVAEPIKAGKLVVILDKSYSQKGLPSIPEAEIRSRVGKVNAAAWQGCAAETLMFIGASSRKSYTAEGKAYYDITYKFKERPAAGWNSFYNPVADAWEELKALGAGGIPADNPTEFYETTDFQAFFNAPLG